MNFKKAALLVLICVTAFPAISSAKPSNTNDNPIVYPMKHISTGMFLIHLITFGHKGR